MKTMTFLLVEDDEIFMYLHAHIIRSIIPDASIIEKRSSVSALEYILALKEQNQPAPDRILLDINMPEMGGFELLEKIEDMMQDELKNTLIYMVSSSLYEKDRAKAMSYKHVKGFKEKPMTATNMKEIIDGL